MKLSLPDRSVLMLMGAAGSGKSTLATALATRFGAKVISYDAHQRAQPHDDGRAPVGARAFSAALAEFTRSCAEPVPVIIDGTHSRLDRRIAVRRIAIEHGRPTVVLVLLVDPATCLSRQLRRARHVPESDVVKQHQAITAALPDLHREGTRSSCCAPDRRRGPCWWRRDRLPPTRPARSPADGVRAASTRSRIDRTCRCSVNPAQSPDHIGRDRAKRA